jgi:hypothetical protein
MNPNLITAINDQITELQVEMRLDTSDLRSWYLGKIQGLRQAAMMIQNCS